jgi:hypothetical protein
MSKLRMINELVIHRGMDRADARFAVELCMLDGKRDLGNNTVIAWNQTDGFYFM